MVIYSIKLENVRIKMASGLHFHRLEVPFPVCVPQPKPLLPFQPVAPLGLFQQLLWFLNFVFLLQVNICIFKCIPRPPKYPFPACHVASSARK